MKKVLVALFSALLLALSGCATADIKRADDVSIYYGFSSYAMFGADQAVIDDLVNWYNGLTFERTDQTCDVSTMLMINFFSNDKLIKRISVDRNGIATLGGDGRCYRISPDTLNYDFPKGIYEDSKTDRPLVAVEWRDLTHVSEDPFRYLMKHSEPADLRYIKNGELIGIEFAGEAPDDVEIRDYVLREDGSVKYASPDGDLYAVIPVALKGGKGAFELQGNIASLLSSNSADYAPGRTIRGLLMTCRWGQDEREYAFVFRSDAAITFEHVEN